MPERNVLITGATSGIGLQLAKDYLSDGYNVVALGRNTDSLCDLKNEFNNLSLVKVDICNKDDLLSSMNKLSSEVSCLDLVVLNAGTCEYLDTENFDSEIFKKVFEVNVIAQAYCIECMLPYLRKSKRPVLALMGSSASYFPFIRAEAYGGSKAAISYIAESLKVDLSREGIDVKLISPGFVKTPLTDKNEFNMPLRISVERASGYIRAGLESKKFEIAFPMMFITLLRILRALPRFIKHKIARKLEHK